MHKIFNETNLEEIYNNCMIGFIAHAIMVGKYPTLNYEQSWDMANYSFNDSCGGRGTISFDENYFVCVVQKNVDYKKYNSEKVLELFSNATENIIKLANEEALQYVLDNVDGKKSPVISIAFWGDKNNIFSNMEEDEIINISEGILNPILNKTQKNLPEYWEKTFDMNSDQVKLMQEIYDIKINTKEKIVLSKSIEKQLQSWFNDISECFISFSEINIYFED